MEFPVSMAACFSTRSKPCVQLMFSRLAFLNRQISLHVIDEETCHLSHCLSDLWLYTKELCRTTCNPSLAPGPFEDWMVYINRTLSTLSLGLGLYENWRGHINPYSVLLYLHWLHLSSGSVWGRRDFISITNFD